MTDEIEALRRYWREKQAARTLNPRQHKRDLAKQRERRARTRDEDNARRRDKRRAQKEEANG